MLTEQLSKKYTLPIFLAIIFGIYTYCVMPAHSWISEGVDHFDFILAAKYQITAHSTGFPTYMWLANLVLFLTPFAHPAWSLAFFLSAIPAIVSILLVFKITEFLIRDIESIERKIWIPYIAALTTAGATILLSQSFIVEVYAFSIMIALATIYFHLINKYNIAAIFMGLGLGSHGLIWLMLGLIGLLNFKIYFPRLLIIIPITIVLYSYVFLTIHNQTEWEFITLLNFTQDNYIEYFKFGMSGNWWGSLPIWNLPERILDTLSLLIISLGTTILGLIFLTKLQLTQTKFMLISILPALYYWFGTSVPVVYVHLALVVPIIIIVASIGLINTKLPIRYFTIIPAFLILLIPFNWDIGKNADPQLSAQTYYNNLNTYTPDKDVIITSSIILDEIGKGMLYDGTAVWWAILQHNRDNNRNLFPVIIARYFQFDTKIKNQPTAIWYRELLHSRGFNTPYYEFTSSDGGYHWNIIYGSKTIEIPITTYDSTCNIGCQNPVKSIEQFKRWYAIDTLATANPQFDFHIFSRSGAGVKIIQPIKYTRDLLPNNVREGINAINQEVYR